MFPTLQIGPLALPTYPLLMILGYFVGLWFASKIAVRRGLASDHVYDMGFYALIAGVLAGRIGHILFYFPAYRLDPLSVLSPNPNALSPIVAGLAAIWVVAWYQRRYDLPLPALGDAFAGGALVFLAFRALAQGLNGLDFGEPTMAPWAIYQWNVARHPVQFYELLGVVAVLLWLWTLLPRLRPGFAALFALGGYAGVRLIVDAFRAEPVLVGQGFRLSQVIAWILLILILLIFYQDAIRHEKTSS